MLALSVAISPRFSTYNDFILSRSLSFNSSNFLKFQLRRKVTNLYKRFLIILEDMNEDQYNTAEEAYQKARKKILDEGNDTIRELEENIDQFDIRLK